MPTFYGVKFKITLHHIKIKTTPGKYVESEKRLVSAKSK